MVIQTSLDLYDKINLLGQQAQYDLCEAEGKPRDRALSTAYAMCIQKYDRKPPWSWRDLEPKEPSAGVVNYVKSRRIAYRHRRAA